MTTSTTATASGPGIEATPPALAVEGLSVGYGSTMILRDVSLTVPSGGAVALLGPNGAGKSTLLATLSGLLPITEGRVSIAGQDVTGRPAHRLAEAGLSHIPEGRGVFRGLTVRENLVMQAGKGSEAEAIDRAVSAFPVLGERLTQQAGTMSGGQQQMLAMSAAYVRHPRLVLVDEASLGLAPLVVDEIFGFLSRLVEEGAALLLVDQFAARALAMASHAYVLNRGRIVYSGLAAELDEETLAQAYLGSDQS